MDQFKWGTDEEHDPLWDGQTSLDQKKNEHVVLRRRLAIGLLILGLTAVTVWGGWRLANSTVTQAEQETKGEVLASYRLLNEASAEIDAELLTNLLSGRDRSWVSAQMGLFREGLRHDRPQFSLTALTTPGGLDASPMITLSSDLNTATVITILSYEGEEPGRSVELLHTELYRRGDSGWLLSPLDTDEWRSTATFNSPVLRATFPLADQAVGERLTTDLSQILVNLCGGPFELSCSFFDNPLELTFDLNPRTLLELETDEPSNSIRQIRRLPAPSLVGRPLDEAGYQTLLKGYIEVLISGWLREREEEFWQGNTAMAAAAARIRLAQNGVAKMAEPRYPQLDDAEQNIALLCLKQDTIDLVRLTTQPKQFERLSTGFLATELLVDAADERVALRGALNDQRGLKLWPLDTQNFPLEITNDLQQNDDVDFFALPEPAF